MKSDNAFSRSLDRPARIAVSVLALMAATFAIEEARADGPDAFGGFIVGLRDVCAQKPARDCTRRVVDFADGDHDQRISLREFEILRADAATSVGDRSSALSPVERNLITIGLFTLQHAKPALVFANFDADGDGALSERELFADFRLDHRPMGDIIADPQGVDWQRFTARFGKVGFLVRDLLPAGKGK